MYIPVKIQKDKKPQNAKDENIKYYHTNFDNLCRDYEDKFLVIHRNRVWEPLIASSDDLQSRDNYLSGLDKKTAEEAYCPSKRMPAPKKI